MSVSLSGNNAGLNQGGGCCRCPSMPTKLFTPWSTVLLRSRNSPHFMEPEGSLPHSQVPATCPYPEPAGSSSSTSHYLNIHLSIILPSRPGYSKLSLFLRFPHRNCVYVSPLPHTRYMPRPSQSRFDHPNNIG